MNDQPNNRYSPRNFIKGKTVEIIFEQMFRETDRFTIIPFGYQHTLPEIAQYAHMVKYQPVFDNIRTAPDFVIVSQDRTSLFMVEVKYRTAHTQADLVEISKKILERWDAIWLFLATQDGFYFDSCTNIIKNAGAITPLDFGWVPEDIQKQYLGLLKEFIK